MIPHTRPLTLDVYDDPPRTSQSESFRRVQAGFRAKHAEQFTELRDIAVRLAAKVGATGFDVDQLMEEAGGRNRFPRNAPGVVLGSLRSVHAICVVGRRKAGHAAAKGRFVNVFALNAGAIRVVEP